MRGKDGGVTGLHGERGVFIFCTECNSKKFGLPYFHHQKVKITNTYAGIYVSA